MSEAAATPVDLPTPEESAPAVCEAVDQGSSLGFWIYCLFICSWFVHLGYRFTPLGMIRFDLLLVATLAGLSIMSGGAPTTSKSTTGTWLKAIILFSILTVPFVRWPGSVLNNLPTFIKAIVFFYFTVAFVTTERKLRIFLMTFVFCQTFRVIEPLYLHLTTGYWGDSASMSGYESMNRLSGAPSDIVNPNGLAFIIVSVIPFWHYIVARSFTGKVLYVAALPAMLYALILTASRSGLLGLATIFGGIFLKSDKKALLGVLGIIGAVVAFSSLDDNQKDRYLSIFSSNTKNAETSSGRVDGVFESFGVAAKRPIFGHGLGTSGEATFHDSGDAYRAHNLYAEVAQELGFVGLAIFLGLIWSILKNFATAQRTFRESDEKAEGFLAAALNAMQVWMLMNILFSFASYGLHSYEWYLFGGLSVCLAGLTALHAKPQLAEK